MPVPLSSRDKQFKWAARKQQRIPKGSKMLATSLQLRAKTFQVHFISPPTSCPSTTAMAVNSGGIKRFIRIANNSQPARQPAPMQESGTGWRCCVPRRCNESGATTSTYRQCGLEAREQRLLGLAELELVLHGLQLAVVLKVGCVSLAAHSGPAQWACAWQGVVVWWSGVARARAEGPGGDAAGAAKACHDSCVCSSASKKPIPLLFLAHLIGGVTRRCKIA